MAQHHSHGGDKDLGAGYLSQGREQGAECWQLVGAIPQHIKNGRKQCCKNRACNLAFNGIFWYFTESIPQLLCLADDLRLPAKLQSPVPLIAHLRRPDPTQPHDITDNGLRLDTINFICTTRGSSDPFSFPSLVSSCGNATFHAAIIT
jgi:hypothetical protein